MKLTEAVRGAGEERCVLSLSKVISGSQDRRNTDNEAHHILLGDQDLCVEPLSATNLVSSLPLFDTDNWSAFEVR